MKAFIAVLVLVLVYFFPASIIAQENTNEPKYSMQTYYFVLLKDGPNNVTDTVELKRIQEGHMSNIKAMAKTGKLKLAGPFEAKSDIRGIFIIDAASEDEVKELLKNDPAITSEALIADIRLWYGPKGLKVEPDK